MPLSKYFGGHGERVMREMQAAHGTKAGMREFYATANKQKKRTILKRSKGGR